MPFVAHPIVFSYLEHIFQRLFYLLRLVIPEIDKAFFLYVCPVIVLTVLSRMEDSLVHDIGKSTFSSILTIHVFIDINGSSGFSNC